MSELMMIWTLIASLSLFALGGTEIPKFGRGFKVFRRFVLPILLGVIAYLSHVSWWQAVLYSLGLCLALHMGYGDRAAYWKKVLIFCAYSGVSLCIGFSWWVVITPVLLTLLFIGSNWKPTASSIYWKSWEGLAGFLIAASLIAALQNRYL